MNTFNIFSIIKQPRGMGLLGILFILIIFLILIFLGDLGFIFFSEECLGQEPMECIFGMFDEGDDAAPQGAVTATGVLSGEFNGEDHSVTVSMSFPLGGGDVTGSFSGDCDGSIKGTYAGGDGGAISGKGSGSCGFVVPASGSFSGTVNEGSKSVNINGSGSALGITKTGSMSLGY